LRKPDLSLVHALCHFHPLYTLFGKMQRDYQRAARRKNAWGNGRLAVTVARSQSDQQALSQI
jgi:hypothetical protein